jgi:DNA repair protein RadC
MTKEDIHKGHRERLKNRFLRNGLKDFEHHNILELLLFFGISMRDTNDIAHRLIREFGDIASVFDAPYEELCKVKGVGPNAATLIKLLPEISNVYLDNANKKKKVYDSFENIGEFLLPKFVGHTKEVVYVICLDGNLHIKNCTLLCEGTATSANIDIKKIVELSIRHNCHNIVISHNHPQGLPIPSAEDVRTTEHLIKALRMLGITLLDHIIVARGEFSSIALLENL